MFFKLLPVLFGFILFTNGAVHAESFDQWKKSFRADALTAGVGAATYDREMASVEPIARVMELNDNQPEFTRAIWDYLDTAVSDQRISNGLNNKAAQQAVLEKIEAVYGVDAEIIVAIWGLESSYGAIMGDYDVLSALATLGYEGRRVQFGRSQLIAALKIIDKGYATRDQLKGSWAGAMGQTQFIPTTYLEYAVDHDVDGHKDLWANQGDVFASTANYLSRSGYIADAPWGFEVILPADFDFAAADKSNKRTIAYWASQGLTHADGTSLTDGADLNMTGWVIVPAGAKGPAFLVFNNFKAILRYNNSTHYALGIGLLADNIALRAQPISKAWPRDDRPLSLSERKSLQAALTAKGYNPGPIDGIIGAGTRAAIRQWQKDNGLPADGYASASILTALKG